MTTINSKKLNNVKGVAIADLVAIIIAEVLYLCKKDEFNLFLLVAAALLLAITITIIKETRQKAVECQVCHSKTTTEFCPICGTQIAKTKDDEDDSIEVVSIDASDEIDEDFFAAEKEYNDTDDDIVKIQKALVKNILDEKAEMDNY